MRAADRTARKYLLTRRLLLRLRGRRRPTEAEQLAALAVVIRRRADWLRAQERAARAVGAAGAGRPRRRARPQRPPPPVMRRRELRAALRRLARAPPAPEPRTPAPGRVARTSTPASGSPTLSDVRRSSGAAARSLLRTPLSPGRAEDAARWAADFDALVAAELARRAAAAAAAAAQRAREPVRVLGARR
jgi:hypothetical protein